MGRLLAAASPTYRPALATGLFAGVRVSELLGLKWEDVDLKEKVLRVRFQMDRKGRRQPLKTDAGRRDVILMWSNWGESYDDDGSPRASRRTSTWSSLRQLDAPSVTATSQVADWRRPALEQDSSTSRSTRSATRSPAS
jgi:integrase